MPYIVVLEEPQIASGETASLWRNGGRGAAVPARQTSFSAADSARWQRGGLIAVVVVAVHLVRQNRGVGGQLGGRHRLGVQGARLVGGDHHVHLGVLEEEIFYHSLACARYLYVYRRSKDVKN